MKPKLCRDSSLSVTLLTRFDRGRHCPPITSGLRLFSAEFSEDEVGLILDGAVALARRHLQGFPVQNGDVTTGVANDAGFLKGTSPDCHAGVAHSQHDGEVFVGQREMIAVSAVVRHQKPARKPFIK
jgi:hypothetical protein